MGYFASIHCTEVHAGPIVEIRFMLKICICHSKPSGQFSTEYVQLRGLCTVEVVHTITLRFLLFHLNMHVHLSISCLKHTNYNFTASVIWTFWSTSPLVTLTARFRTSRYVFFTFLVLSRIFRAMSCLPMYRAWNRGVLHLSVSGVMATTCYVSFSILTV